MRTRSDPLSTTVKDICDLTAKLGLVIFYGWAYDEDAITWNEEHGGDWNKFIETAKALGAKLIYLNWAQFEEFQVDEALEKVIGEAEESPDSERPEVEKRRLEIEKYRDKVGLTVVIDLAFTSEGVFHTYQSFAPWFVAFEDLTPEEDGDEEEELVENKTDRTLIDKWANILANHPKFGSCKSYQQREYLLEGQAKEEYETLPVHQILSRADTIYTMEVRPKADLRLQEEARKLRHQGLNMNAIALKLGISRDRVSGLLAE